MTYLTRLFGLTPLTRLEEAERLNIELTIRSQHLAGENLRLTTALAAEQASHLREIKQLTNYVSTQQGGRAVFSDIPQEPAEDYYSENPEPFERKLTSREKAQKQRAAFMADTMVGFQDPFKDTVEGANVA